jgi:predicted GNAT family acetyltransferase
MSQEIKHKENDTRGMFYLEDEKGITSQLTYTKQSNGVLLIDYTETKPELEGKGLASLLLKRSVEYARENNYKINPLCPFAEVQFDEHKEYRDVLAV